MNECQKRLIYQIKQYLKYKLTSGYWRGHRIHSPFTFELVNVIINSPHAYYHFETIEDYRRTKLRDNTIIEHHDYGTARGAVIPKTISQMTKVAAVNPKFGRLLSRLVCFMKPKNIVEIGTSLGFGTLYLSMASRTTAVYTLEGCPNCAAAAQESFNKFELSNVHTHIGNFDDTLPSIIDSLDSVDMVYFDGNHTYDATMRYFNICLPKRNANTIFIFDDIHYSPQMTQAWNEICADERVVISIDLFRMGLVFFRQGCQKEHYQVRW